MDVKGKHVKLQVWDTAGQERFKAISQTFYKGAAAIVLVYDRTNRKSFDNITSWMKQIETHSAKDSIIYLVANKIDFEEHTVSSEEGKELASEFGCTFFETSAKTGENIGKLFDSVAEKLVDGARPGPEPLPEPEPIRPMSRLCKWLSPKRYN